MDDDDRVHPDRPTDRPCLLELVGGAEAVDDEVLELDLLSQRAYGVEEVLPLPPNLLLHILEPGLGDRSSCTGSH